MDLRPVHLHVHSQYSLLEGTATVEALAEQAAAWGMPALALTDRDALYGAVPFARAARSYGVRPIAGLCLTMAGGSSLTLLARDRQGYANLCRLSSLQQTRPAGAPAGLSLETLADHRQGLVVLTGGREGPLWSPALRGEEAALREVLSDLVEAAAPGSLYVEVQWLDRRDDRAVTGLVETARSLGLPLAATHPVYTLHQAEADLGRLLGAIRLGCTMDTPRLIREAPAGRHMLSPEELANRFRELPEALAGTAGLAASCQDAFPRPGEFLRAEALPIVQMAAGLLRSQVERALARRYGDPPPDEVLERVERELAVLEAANLSALILMLGEGLAAACEQGLLPLLDGGAVGSLLLHLLGATWPDPQTCGLEEVALLPPGERTLPLLPLWLDSTERPALAGLLRGRWGTERCLEVGGVLPWRDREAWRAAARAYDLHPTQVEEIARWLYREEPDRRPEVLTKVKAEGPAVRLALLGARALAGRPARPAGQAQGWALLAQAPASTLPVVGEGSLTQYGPEDMAFLGGVVLRPQEKRELALLSSLLRRVRPGLPAPSALPSEDAATADLLRAGRTLGCGLLGRPAVRRLLREVAPTSLSGLMTVLALQRPAALRAGLARTFARRRVEGRPALPAFLEEIVGRTRGLWLYREQVWRFLIALDWPPEEAWAFLADLASGRLTAQERSRWWMPFMQRASQAGLGQDLVGRLWTDLLGAGDHLFSAARMAAEAALLWRLAWFKTHDPAAFFAAALEAGGWGYPPAVLMAEARHLGLRVCPPHVHHSGRRITLERPAAGPPTLWLGLEAVRGLSEETMAAILEARREGPFRSVEEFILRARPTPNEALRLAQAGALDGLAENRAAVLQEVRWRTRDSPSQMLLPFQFEEKAPPLSLAEVLKAEQEALGMAVSVHPLDLWEERLRKLSPVSSLDLAEREGQQVTVAGVVLSWRRLADGGVLMLEDRQGGIEAWLEGEVWGKIAGSLRSGDLVVLQGEVRPISGTAAAVWLVARQVERWTE